MTKQTNHYFGSIQLLCYLCEGVMGRMRGAQGQPGLQETLSREKETLPE